MHKKSNSIVLQIDKQEIKGFNWLLFKISGFIIFENTEFNGEV